ncbi:MAG: hypothetical protein C0429_17055 [Sphingopyxis sp.]|nr:hypothetical protein [Sphingopyxis sp.]
MKSKHILAILLGALVTSVAVEAQIGSTRYDVNGTVYNIPHSYEFERNFQIPWLEGLKAGEKEATNSVWLTIPASELARDITGYSRLVRGYVPEVEMDMVIHVYGGQDALKFPQFRADQIQKVSEAIKKINVQEPDKSTGWQRIYWLGGGEGAPSDGGSLFYLIPKQGLDQLPSDWNPPSCQRSEDVKGLEYFDCKYVVYRNGLVVDFHLDQENLDFANEIPNYVLARLRKWER